jgi:hypothetical protein
MHTRHQHKSIEQPCWAIRYLLYSCSADAFAATSSPVQEQSHHLLLRELHYTTEHRVGFLAFLCCVRVALPAVKLSRDLRVLLFVSLVRQWDKDSARVFTHRAMRETLKQLNAK